MAQSLKYYGNYVTNDIQNVLLIIAMTGAGRLMKEKRLRMFFLNMSTRFRLVFEECFTYVLSCFRVCKAATRFKTRCSNSKRRRCVVHAVFNETKRIRSKQTNKPNSSTRLVHVRMALRSNCFGSRCPLLLVIVNAPGRRRCGLLFISIVNIIIIIYVRCIRLQTAIQLWPTVVLPTTT